MPDIKGHEVTASEAANLYKHYPGFWFLLEVLKMNEEGKAELMRVVNLDKSKEVLREYLLEELTDANSKYIFVYADPGGKCEV